MKLLWQSVTLILSFSIVFIWQNSPLKDFTVQMLGLLIALYLIIAAKGRGKAFLTLGGGGYYGIFILNTLIFLLIFATGGLNSNLFFVLYFLAFGIAFIFDPLTVLVFIAGTFLVFFPELWDMELSQSLLKLGSLALISPLAYFFGREYKARDIASEKVNALKERTKEAADNISEDIDEVLGDEKANLRQKDVEKLNEVLEETEDLREESRP